MSAREHDGLVVAAVDAGGLALVRAEEARELWTPELVAERRAANRSLRHDRERRGETLREFGVLAFPRLREAGDVQVAHHEAADARVGARAAAGRRLVADFAAHARRRARIGRDSRGMVVGFDLHQLVELHLAELVDVVRGLWLVVRGSWLTNHETRITNHVKHLRREALHHGRVVLVGDERALSVLLVGVLDHPEEGVLLLLPVDDELGTEDFVAAVLGVDLSEHHELRVRGVASRGGERLGEVLHLGLADREAERDICLADRLHAAPEHVERDAGLRRRTVEEVAEVRVHAFGHAVVERAECGRRHRGRNVEADAALDAHDALQTAVAEDVGRLRRPRGDRALARRNEEDVVRGSWFAVRGSRFVRKPITNHERRITNHAFRIEEQRRTGERFGVGAVAFGFDRIHPAGFNPGVFERRIGGDEGGAQGVEAERRVRRGSHHQNRFHSLLLSLKIGWLLYHKLADRTIFQPGDWARLTC